MDKLYKASEDLKIKEIAVAGGVSANSALRSAFEEYSQKYGWKIHIPKFAYTTDNAAMVAISGYYKYLDKSLQLQILLLLQGSQFNLKTKKHIIVMEENKKSLNFIEQIVEKDLREGHNDGRIQTRFPPEPNGYLHIGHAKAICIDFGIAEKYNGICNLRFDDTNPVKEDVEYVDSIMEDIKWLGFHWDNIYYASIISSNYGILHKTNGEGQSIHR